MIAAADHVRRETLVSIAINAVLSLAFFCAFFAPFADVGIAAYAMDFAPQSFAIALMSVLVPGILTRRKLAAGGIAHLPGRSRLPRRLVVRALLLAAMGGLIGLILGVSIGRAMPDATLPWLPAAALKIIYGAALAAIITPIGLRAALRIPDRDHSHRSRR